MSDIGDLNVDALVEEVDEHSPQGGGDAGGVGGGAPGGEFEVESLSSGGELLASRGLPPPSAAQFQQGGADRRREHNRRSRRRSNFKPRNVSHKHPRRPGQGTISVMTEPDPNPRLIRVQERLIDSVRPSSCQTT